MSDTPKPASPGRGFPPSSRILRRAEFKLVYEKGLRVPGSLFAAFCLARDSPQELRTKTRATGPRLGITVPRTVAGAVGRNRLKRRFREAFRLHRAELDPKWDIVLNPRRPALDVQFRDIEQALEKLIRKCNSR
ncbi:MAG TPA: ribonuclease P protein component [Bryobacteraceae bacterium]